MKQTPTNYLNNTNGNTKTKKKQNQLHTYKIYKNDNNYQIITITNKWKIRKDQITQKTNNRNKNKYNPKNQGGKEQQTKKNKN